MKAKLQPGDVVKWTSKWLKSAGIHGGSTPRESFTVKACACPQCTRGEWVNLGVPLEFDYRTPGEIDAGVPPIDRHAVVGNLTLGERRWRDGG